MFHLLNSLGILLLEYFLPSLCDHLFKHKVVIDEQKLKPGSFTFTFNFDLCFEFVVDCFVLALDEFVEFLSPIGKLDFPSDSFEENVDPFAKDEENSKNDKVEESKLNDQEEDVDNNQHQDELHEAHN